MLCTRWNKFYATDVAVEKNIDQTYISTRATFGNRELEDGNRLIHKDWLAFWIPRNDELGGVHLEGRAVVFNGENKVFIWCAF